MKRQQYAPPLKDVRIDDAFWSYMQNLTISVVLPYQRDILEDRNPAAAKSHAVENFRIAAGEAEGEFHGMVFQDSDVAKWLEAVAYALTVRPDPELEAEADRLIELIGRAQQPDGYLNTYFTVKEPERKWQNLHECHELYCSGHMIEAAVAYCEATGKDAFLNIMRKNADLICRRFGKGKIRGIPGHQEIELALLRLYQATGEKTYLETARYFIDERGTEPSCFAEEIKTRGWHHWGNTEDREHAQNHLPVRQQDKAVGHSVRAAYMYTSMAALAAETGDEELLAACRVLWDNITQKRMYITGGIGSTAHGEAFTADYDLPNDTIYAETCASVAMVFFARQLLELQVKGEYADLIERELYNGVLSGMQLDGKRFFYVNPLEAVPGVSGTLPGYRHVLPERPEWYACACCPPNVARLITSLGRYAWGECDKGIYSHLYIGGGVTFKSAGGVRVDCETGYPWDGSVRYAIRPETAGAGFFFAVRIPGWCKEWTLTVNGAPAEFELRDGYAYITRRWGGGDVVGLTLGMEPRRVYANVRVRAGAGCVALTRGPVVYCLEEADNGPNLSALRLPRSAVILSKREHMEPLGGIVTLNAEGYRLQSGDDLYSDSPPVGIPVTLRAVPYFTWGNRGAGGMRVWAPEQP